MSSANIRWAGRLELGVGVARLDARIGDSAMHRHLAMQLSIGCDGPITVTRPDGEEISGEAVVIAGGVPHRIGPSGRHVRSLYIEPRLALARRLARDCGPDGVAAMAADTAEVHWSLSKAAAGDTTMEAREAGLAALANGTRPELSVADWARALQLSSSRLRAICVATFGVPPARLRQWGRLISATRAIAAGDGLAEAAIAAGYADQAHFTRQLRAWFGVSPARGLGALDIQVVE